MNERTQLSILAGADDARPTDLDATHDPGVATARERAARTRGDAAEAIPIGDALVRVGIASWTDPTMTRPGVFYPPEARTPEARLRHIASRVAVLEVDATYYALPARSTAAAWAARTPAGFVLDVKAHALMTGQPTEVRRLPDWLRRALPRPLASSPRIRSDELPCELLDETWTRFLDALQPLRDAGKLGAVLLQYPRSFTPSRESAAELRLARERLGDDVLGAVELRNRAWAAGRIGTRTLELLGELGLAHVCVDAPPGTESSMPPVVAVTSPRLAIARFHGRRAATWEARNPVAVERYRWLYDRETLAEWVPRIAELARGARDVHVVMNNCYGNYGTTNALELAAMLAAGS